MTGVVASVPAGVGKSASAESSPHLTVTPIGEWDGSSIESAPHAPVAQMDRVATSEGTT
jgi:hypothetical protein